MDISKHIADTSTGVIRLVTLRLTQSEAERASQSRFMSEYVAGFLNRSIRPPCRYKQFSALSFAISAPWKEREFDAYVLHLNDRLKRFLFGTQRETDTFALVFAGNETEIAAFLTESDEDAIKRSAAFVRRTEATLQSPEEHPPDRTISPVPGKRPLLFRGVLECKHSVLLAYALTPSGGEQFYGDIDLSRYLSFLGPDAIDFEIRVFERASRLLRSAEKQAKPIILICPLSYQTLQNRAHRERFLGVVERHPQTVRDQMIISVIGAPGTPPSSLLQRFTAEFSVWFKYLDWQIPTADFMTRDFVGSHMHSITLDMHSRSSDREHDIEKFIRKIPELRNLNIRPAVTGIRNRSELDQCISGGVIYASGDAVTSALYEFTSAHTVLVADLPLNDVEHIAA